MNYLEFLKIYEKHYVEMSTRKIGTRKERRTYIEEQLNRLGFNFIIDETKEDAKKDEQEIVDKNTKPENPEDAPKSSNFFLNIVSKVVGTKSKDLAPQPIQQPNPKPEIEDKINPKLKENFIIEAKDNKKKKEIDYNADPEFKKYCLKYWGDIPKNLDPEEVKEAYLEYLTDYGDEEDVDDYVLNHYFDGEEFEDEDMDVFDYDEFDDFYGGDFYGGDFYDTRYSDDKEKGNQGKKYYRDEYGTLRHDSDYVKKDNPKDYKSGSRYGERDYGSSRYSSGYGGSRYGGGYSGGYTKYDYTSYRNPFVMNFYRDYSMKDNIVVFANGFDIKKPTRILMAHYDVNTESSAHDNANDNGASVIILLEYLEKKKFPSDKNIIVVFSDGEEFGGQGAKSLGTQINKGFHGNVEWVLNLDVVGIGDIVVFEDEPGKLRNRINGLFKEGEVGFIKMPPNDGMYLRTSGIDSLCLSVLPEKYWNPETKKLVGRPEIWSFLHSTKDKWETIETNALTITLDAVTKIMNS